MIKHWKGEVPFYQSALISTVHGFSTKEGGVSVGEFSSLNLILPRGDTVGAVTENYGRFHDAIGYTGGLFARNSQVHGNTIRVVRKDTACSLDTLVRGEGFPSGDGLVTGEEGIALWVYSADCVPILFHDPVASVVGAVHSGWRGTAEGIASEMIQTMVREFSSVPSDIQVALGPAIGPCCFSCHRDVVDAMEDALGEKVAPYIQEEGEKYAVNLHGINGLWLRGCGVEQIDMIAPCTACHGKEFWSHRVLGDGRGSMGAMIALGGGR